MRSRPSVWRTVTRSVSPLRGLQGECRSPASRSRLIVVRRLLLVDGYELADGCLSLRDDAWGWVY